jgi:hypothetical protein
MDELNVVEADSEVISSRWGKRIQYFELNGAVSRLKGKLHRNVLHFLDAEFIGSLSVEIDLQIWGKRRWSVGEMRIGVMDPKEKVTSLILG